ncbi:MAG: hypothetical protein ACLQVY_09205 [Limisphaerales bacterium]
MTQKEMLAHALSFVESPYRGNAPAMKAARASCVIEWLHDMNLHPEADAIQEKLDSLRSGVQTIMEADENGARARERGSIASFLNHLYGWGLETLDWNATAGAALVEELWALISALP